MYVCVCVSVCVYMHVYMHACVYVCVYVRVNPISGMRRLFLCTLYGIQQRMNLI